jgi:hypothetical protein
MQAYYLQKADENLPALHTTVIRPEAEGEPLKNGDTLILDLGNHYVGYFSFGVRSPFWYNDAPLRLEMRFCETARELEDDYTDYHGSLCRSWLQDEIINVDFPGICRMPRRYAARYILIKVQYTSQPVVLEDFAFEAVTSADMGALKPYDTQDEELAVIDRVAVHTLRNCMQRVYEDGPKRDRRLWIGDLRLEALANYYTFGNTALVKRCLYLFAAADKNPYGLMPGYVYENPGFVSGYWHILDYGFMFVNTLCDLYGHTGDTETFRDLYDVAKKILDSAEENKDDQGLIDNTCGDWFIDWCPGLHKAVAFEGIYLYTLDQWSRTLEALGYPEAAEYRARLEAGRAASRKYLYDAEKKAFINARDEYQYSVHAAAWMVLGGVDEGEEAKEVLLKVMNDGESVKPFTPYMHHYAVDALFCAGARAEAEQHLRHIWGGMVKAGADTFFEAYVPTDPDFSPYGDRKMNSNCHAWSCTATYFIRKYGLGQD